MLGGGNRLLYPLTFFIMEKTIIESALKIEILNNNIKYALGLGGNIQVLDEISEALFDVVWEQRGLPKDTTTELGFDHKDSFCRDYFQDAFYEWLISDGFNSVQEITDKEIDKVISLLDEGMQLHKKEVGLI